MTLQEWLFNGGDPSLPAVKFVDWLGGECGFCAVYRSLALALAFASGWAFGPVGFVGSIILMAAVFVGLKLYAKSLPIPPEDLTDEL